MKDDPTMENHFSAGYHRTFHRGSIGAVILIGIGLIFLLNNLGILPLDVWQNLWRFWPAILILIGLQMVLGRNPLANLVVLIVGLVFIALVVLISLAPTNPQVSSWINQYLPGFTTNNSQNPSFDIQSPSSDINPQTPNFNNNY